MSQEVLPLWPELSDSPSLTLYPADTPTPRGGVMVLPGGGYGGLADHEGGPIAKQFNAAGFDAAVLRYRVAPHRHPDMIHDAQRGMRMMRQHQAIRAQKIAVLGFSAGGHLASTLTVHYDRFRCEQDDLVGAVSARPDAAVLCYAVIDLVEKENLNVGSRDKLLGPDASTEMLELMSTQRHVTGQTPPTFLWHTADDTAVPVGNSLAFAAACQTAKVPMELHVYEHGRHGLGLANDLPQIAGWFDLAQAFLGRHLDAAEPVAARPSAVDAAGRV